MNGFIKSGLENVNVDMYDWDWIGLVSGVCFSDLGNDVICVDKDLNKINHLKKENSNL